MRGGGRFVCDKGQFEMADDAIDNCIVSNEVENTSDKPYNRGLRNTEI
jgi:hypothetical protein